MSNRATTVVTDPYTNGVLALVSAPSYDPNLSIDGISSKDYSALLNDPNTLLMSRAAQGVHPPASTVKPYVAVPALSAGVITRNTTLLGPGWWQLPGSEERYHDWKGWGHGRLSATRSLEESTDTFLYQVAHDMGIDRPSEWMDKFGCGYYTGIDLTEERSGNTPTRERKQKCFKRLRYQGDAIPIGIGRGYWTTAPVQISKALMILVSDGIVKVPHSLMGAAEDSKQVPQVQPHEPPAGDIHSGYWELTKDGIHGVANRPSDMTHKYLTSASYKVTVRSGTAQVFDLKASGTYSAHKTAERLRNHRLTTAFTLCSNPQVAVTMILESGDMDPAVGALIRQILNHIMLGDNDADLPAEDPAVVAAGDH